VVVGSGVVDSGEVGLEGEADLGEVDADSAGAD
jgi:hypothetical protein